MRFATLLIALALLLGVVAGCGDDDDEGAATTETTVTETTATETETETTGGTAGDIAAGEEASPPPAAAAVTRWRRRVERERRPQPRWHEPQLRAGEGAGRERRRRDARLQGPAERRGNRERLGVRRRRLAELSARSRAAPAGPPGFGVADSRGSGSATAQSARALPTDRRRDRARALWRQPACGSLAPSLAIDRRTCVSTVSAEMPRDSAASPLVMPRARHASTSRSRGDSEPAAGCRASNAAAA